MPMSRWSLVRNTSSAFRDSKERRLSSGILGSQPHQSQDAPFWVKKPAGKGKGVTRVQTEPCAHGKEWYLRLEAARTRTNAYQEPVALTEHVGNCATSRRAHGYPVIPFVPSGPSQN